MATSRETHRWTARWPWGLALLLAAATGCSPEGTGEGSADGTISIPDCDIAPEPFSLEPTFFAAEPVVDFLSIRMQRNSEPVDRADGVMVQLVSATEVKEHLLGQPIPLSTDPQASVRMSFYLASDCPSDRTMAAPVLSAVGGTITFTAVYAQEVSTDDRLIEATFTDVRFEDPTDPMTYAELSGSFRFLFSRGRPLQVYP